MKRMAGFFDFIKKNPSAASGTPTNGAPTASSPQPVSGQPQVVEQQQVVQAQSQSYNGIGSPPAPAVPVVETQIVTPVQQVTPAPTPVTPSVETTTASVEPVPSTSPAPVAIPEEQGAVSAPVADQSIAPVEEKTAQAVPTEATEPKKEEQPKDVATQKTEETPQDPATAANPAMQKKVDMDVMTHLTQRSNRVFLSANNKAKELQSAEMDSDHLLHGLLSDPEIYKLLTGFKIQPQTVEQELTAVYKKGTSTENPQPSPRIKRILEGALVVARKLGYEFISPEHLLVSTYDEGEGVAARILQKLGLEKNELNKKILGKKAEEGEKKEGEKKKSALQQFTIDLTTKAAEGKLDPVVGRSPEIERVIHILSRRLKNNPVLIGEPGVGKTAIVEGLAQKIVSKQVPETLLDKRILQLDLMAVVAGASHRGEFEQRMKELVEEVEGGKGTIILFIDEIHNIMGAGGGGEGTSDASNFLKPALSRGQIQLIGATTLTEYKIIEKDAALERRFQSVTVPEPDEENAIKMLKALRNKFEAFHRVKIPDDVIEAAVKLSKRYLGDRYLPDKAVDLVDEAASAVRLPLISLPEEIKGFEERIAQLSQERDEADQKGDKVRARILNSKIDDVQSDLNVKKDEYNMKKGQTTTSVTLNIVKDIIAKRTGIPVSKISGSEKEKLSKLEDIMHERMIGQERAVTSVAQSVRRGRAGLKASNRPIGSFVFLGPTGVGKTELAKTLADVLFGQEEAMIRFDMTEYMEKHEVAKLLGPPPGYVGYEEGGKLTEAVRRRQYAVVLFDEVEKAHPDIFNILLQILDDGRLTDNKGRTISFKNTVVICTSNIGSKMIQEVLLKGGKGEAEEPPALSTYAFSPRGREIMTIGTKFFERDGASGKQVKPEQKQDKKNDDKNADKSQDAMKEGASVGGGWNQNMLFDYFAGQKIDNTQKQQSGEGEQAAQQAAPAQDEEMVDFPSLGYDTHAISAQGVEMISRDSIIFMRNATTAKIWQTTTLIEYFKDGVVINALPDAPDEQLPTARLKTHSFSSTGMETVTYRDRYWRRKEGANDWETGELKDYFLDQTVAEGGNFPITHWDVHTYSPTGREVIIVGETIWFRDGDAKQWTTQSLHDYFGNDFPLEAELSEKEKIENETDGKQYNVIKDKVMAELLKFFRPELVNRFDEVIVFEPLKFVHMIEIVKLQLKGVSNALEEQEIGVHITDAAIKEVVRSGFDPAFGARPLRRAIQRLLENPISELIIDEKIKAGDMLYVDYDGEKFIFDIEKTEFIEQKKAQANNYTPVNINAFVEQFFAADKEAIMKQLSELFPEYAQEQAISAIKPNTQTEAKPEISQQSVEAKPSEAPKTPEQKPQDPAAAEPKPTNGKAAAPTSPNQMPMPLNA